ncbi:MAG: hypothetical protein K9M03_04105 [Kiritimatiellales bacterium]|nr:hypothetical protein [Kiritimatiellales bacterium]
MSLITALRHPTLSTSILLEFFKWYFLEMPLKLVLSWGEYMRMVGEIFSFLFLIKTFLKPWKSITDKYPEKGFHLGLIAQAFTLNCTSRIIGMIFRSIALVIGIATGLFVIAIFLAILIVWIFFPVLVVLDLVYLFGTI